MGDRGQEGGVEDSVRGGSYVSICLWFDGMVGGFSFGGFDGGLSKSSACRDELHWLLSLEQVVDTLEGQGLKDNLE